MKENLYSIMQNLSEEDKEEFTKFLEIVATVMMKYGMKKIAFERKKQKDKEVFTANFIGINAKN